MPGAMAGMAGAGLLGTILTNDANASNTAATNATSLAAVQSQEQFQEQMSDTAYQRGTADMKAAGINPMLAYMQGGASSPSGSMPQLSTPQVQNVLGAGVSSAVDAGNLYNQMKNADSQASTAASNVALNTARIGQVTTSAKGQDLANDALESQLGAIKSKANLEQKQSDFNSDQKVFMYDNINKRINAGLGTLNSAMDLASPIKKFFGGGGPPMGRGDYSEHDMLDAAGGQGVLIPQN